MRPNKSAWWRGALPALETELRHRAERRLRHRWADQDDIVADTLFALSNLIESNPRAFPASWHGAAPPPEEDQRSLQRLASRIFSRRLADRYRLDAAELRRSLPLDEAGAAVESGERRLEAREILTAALLALDRLSAADRDLLVLVADGHADAHGLSPRDRQRLKRARLKLGNEMRRLLGTQAPTIDLGET